MYTNGVRDVVVVVHELLGSQKLVALRYQTQGQEC